MVMKNFHVTLMSTHSEAVIIWTKGIAQVQVLATAIHKAPTLLPMQAELYEVGLENGTQQYAMEDTHWTALTQSAYTLAAGRDEVQQGLDKNWTPHTEAFERAHLVLQDSCPTRTDQSADVLSAISLLIKPSVIVS